MKKNSETAKGGKKRMSGWLIALIVVVAIFAAGAICCYTIGGKPADKASKSTPSSVSIVQQDDKH